MIQFWESVRQRRRVWRSLREGCHGRGSEHLRNEGWTPTDEVSLTSSNVRLVSWSDQKTFFLYVPMTSASKNRTKGCSNGHGEYGSNTIFIILQTCAWGKWGRCLFHTLYMSAYFAHRLPFWCFQECFIRVVRGVTKIASENETW